MKLTDIIRGSHVAAVVPLLLLLMLSKPLYAVGMYLAITSILSAVQQSSAIIAITGVLLDSVTD